MQSARHAPCALGLRRARVRPPSAAGWFHSSMRSPCRTPAGHCMHGRSCDRVRVVQRARHAPCARPATGESGSRGRSIPRSAAERSLHARLDVRLRTSDADRNNRHSIRDLARCAGCPSIGHRQERSPGIRHEIVSLLDVLFASIESLVPSSLDFLAPGATSCLLTA